MTEKIDLIKKHLTESGREFTPCFNEQCPLHADCLRHDARLYTGNQGRVINCVNPNYKHATDGQCDFFVSNVPVVMKVGMKRHFFNDMPARTATAIRQRLIKESCRSTFYKYRNGTLPIKPDMQALIERVCREEGWQGALVYDGETTDYLW